MGELDRLVDAMRHKKELGLRPYVLFLGAGASVRSGIPLLKDLAASVIGGTQSALTTSKRAQFDRAWASFSASERYAAFWGAVRGGSPSALTPSEGYFHLARLIESGFFNITITTNADTLLEDSLRLYAQMPARSLKVLIVQEAWRDFEERLRAGASDVKKVVKVHGDAESYFFPFTRFETRELPAEVERELRRLLSEDVIVVGNKLQDWDIQRCLSNTGGSIWQVGPEGPANEIRTAMQHRNCEDNVIRLTFDDFFSELARTLLPSARLTTSWRDGFKQGNLAGIVHVAGEYGFKDSSLTLGREDDQAVVRTSLVFGSDVTVKLHLEILESRTPEDWIGFWARGLTPGVLDGNLVYVRQNGSLEIYGPKGKILATGAAGSTGGEFVLEATYRKREVIARCGGDEIRTPASISGEVLDRQGFLFIWAHHTRVRISNIFVSPAG